MRARVLVTAGVLSLSLAGGLWATSRAWAHPPKSIVQHLIKSIANAGHNRGIEQVANRSHNDIQSYKEPTRDRVLRVLTHPWLVPAWSLLVAGTINGMLSVEQALAQMDTHSQTVAAQEVIKQIDSYPTHGTGASGHHHPVDPLAAFTYVQADLPPNDFMSAKIDAAFIKDFHVGAQTMHEVCVKLGISEQDIQQHFQSKEEWARFFGEKIGQLSIPDQTEIGKRMMDLTLRGFDSFTGSQSYLLTAAKGDAVAPMLDGTLDAGQVRDKLLDLQNSNVLGGKETEPGFRRDLPREIPQTPNSL